MIKYIKEKWKNIKDSFHWLWKAFMRFSGTILGLLFLQILLVFFSMLTVLLNRKIVDFASETMTFQLLSVLALVCLISSILVDVFGNYQMQILIAKLSAKIRLSVTEHILISQWMNRKKMHSEEYVTRLTSDIDIAVDGSLKILIGCIVAVIQLIWAFWLLLSYQSQLAILILIISPIAAIVGVFAGRRLHQLQTKVQQSEANLRIAMEETFQQVDILAAFQGKEQVRKKLADLEDTRIHWIRKKSQCSLITGALVSFIFSFSYLITFCVGATLVSRNWMSYGTMTAMLTLVGQVQNPVYRFCNLLASGIGTLASVQRLRQIDEMPQETWSDESKRTSDQENTMGLEARNLTLSYGEHEVFTNLSFHVPVGEFVMLNGRSGIGKTTLIRCILGFLSPKEGQIFLGNAKEKYPCSPQTRVMISYVSQGKSLFSGTIRDNLKLANVVASEEIMLQALDLACALEFVLKLPQGIDTYLGEQGQGLSEGQAQRIMIARALLKPAKLLLLDEATSALDEATEEKILTNIKTKRPNQTCLFVTHRSSVGKLADQVINL